MTVSEIFDDPSFETFLGHYLGRRYCLSIGSPRRFAELLPWTTLNETLDRLRVSGERVRLVAGGQSVPKHEYLRQDGLPAGSQLNSGSVLACLRHGATLVVDGVDELVAEIRTLAESFEQTFRLQIGINLYAGWLRQHGFALHWDDHDTLILQVHGRKHWAVYEPTLLHPVDKDLAVTPRPTGPPIWEGVLGDGSLLYMPRGWWHVATPMNEPSLHLTVGLNQFKGLDFVKWATARLSADASFRMDVPHLASLEDQQAYVDALRQAVDTALRSVTLADFMTAKESAMPARPAFTLPLLDQALSASMPDMRVKLARTRVLALRNGTAPTTSFEVAGKTWQCSTALRPALALLSSIHGRPLSELERVIPADSVPELRTFVLALLAGGVLCATD